MRNYVISLALVLLLVPLSPLGQTGQTVVLDQTSGFDSLAIGGSIRDNFANLSFTFDISNPTDNDVERQFSIRTDADLYLSNFSLVTGDVRFWGQVKPLSTAQQEYQNATESNQTAVLIQKVGEDYRTSFNLKAQENGSLTFYFEGYIKRVLGEYDITLLDLTSSFPDVNTPLTVDLLLEGSQMELRSARLSGFNGVSVNKLSSNSYQLAYDGTVTLSTPVSIRYKYFSSGSVQTQLLTYSNGTDNFFAYFFAPEVYQTSDIVSREYLFVIDSSGSMTGEYIANAKTAFNSLLDTLTEDDLFNVLEFDDNVQKFRSEAVIGSTSNVDSARNWVNSLVASGGTNIELALSTALESFSTSSSRAKAIVFLSDGQPSAGVGANNPSKHYLIAESIREKNSEKAAIYSISLGTATAEGLMATLAYENGGDFAVIEDSSTLDDSLGRLYENFRYPVGTGLDITYTGLESDVYPQPGTVSNSVFNGSEVIVTGTFGSSLDIETKLTIHTGVETFTAGATSTNDSLSHIERLWAINQINSLLKMNLLGDKPAIKEQIVRLAVTYQLLVEGHTGMVLVVEEVPETTTDNDDGRTVTQTSTASYTGTTNTDTFVASSVPDQPQQAPVSEEFSTLGGILSFTFFSGLFALPVFYRIRPKKD